MTSTFLASIFCQNCGLPVKLDASLLDYSSLDEAQDLAQKSLRIPPQHMHESYILLQKTIPPPAQEEHRGNLSHRLKVANRLFDLINGISDLEHPMCQECSEELLEKLEKRLQDVRNEKVRNSILNYRIFMKDILLKCNLWL
jgi:hypothetical protein